MRPGFKQVAEIVSGIVLSQRHRFSLHEVIVKHALMRRPGDTQKVTRVVFERGDSVAILLHDVETDTIILTYQFRTPVFMAGESGWIHEITAGSLEFKEHPEDGIKREVLEEVGYQLVPGSLRQIHPGAFVSPGGTTERIILFYVQVTHKDKVAEGGGLVKEHEDIVPVAISLDEALRMIQNGQLNDLKTIAAIQWLAMKEHGIVE